MTAPGSAAFGTGGTLVIQTAFLGDVVLTTGLLDVLASRHGPVDVLVTPAAEALLETHPAVRTVIGYDKKGRDRGWAGWKRTADRLRATGYERAYLPHQSVRSAALARWARIPERVGFAGAPGAFWYTRKLPRPKEGHEAERLLALAEGPPDAEARIHLELTEDDRAAAYAWLATKGVGDGFVAMAPGSIWGTKRWGGYGDLARLLPGRIVLIGGPADHAAAQAVVDAAPDRVVDATGDLPLRVSAAVLERARVLITNDSAPLHLASATQTPTVAVFGPTIPAFGFGPRAAQAAIVERALPCRPCSSHGPARCPLGHHRCMREIPAAAVRDAINQLIR
ncbi:MAG: glycosyltransferase family 9 protein [Gemmatimonadales bacterium]